MLKKLFKYDWKSVSLLLFILHGILLFYTLIGRIGISIAMSQSASHVITEDSAQVFGIVGMLYVLGSVYLCHHDCYLRVSGCPYAEEPVFR